MQKIVFLLDYEDNAEWITLDSMILKQILDKNPDKYKYYILKNDDFLNGNNLKKKCEFPIDYYDAIPMGSIQFVSNFINIFLKKFEGENSIEIPPCLRSEYFLKREYKIIPFCDKLANYNYFIKDAEGVKNYINNGEYETINRNHLFVVSERVDIWAEYRVYVIRGTIKNICLYAGNPTFYPDIKLLKRAIEIYSKQDDYPGSISIDVMINERGTSIIEIHSFSSLGLFTTKWDDELPIAYIDGFNYLLNVNSKQIAFFGPNKNE